MLMISNADRDNFLEKVFEEARQREARGYSISKYREERDKLEHFLTLLREVLDEPTNDTETKE